MNLAQNDIIIEPIISEKSTLLASQKKYVFKVHTHANKILVKEAIEKLFNVKVSQCNILNVKGKKRRDRKKRNTYTFTPGWKKAIITLKEGTFDFFETMQ